METNNVREYILCAAIWLKTDNRVVYSPTNIDKGIVFCGWRHCSIFALLNTLYPDGNKCCVQGFLTTKNRFLDREEAKKLAIESGQITDTISSVMTSEDLY